MKKLFVSLSVTLLLSSTTVLAQGPIKNALDRFTDQEKGKTVFIEKGNRALGISGGYRSLTAGGEDALSGDGYAILSLLNIGNGQFQTYSVSPSFSYFLAIQVGYTHYIKSKKH